MLNKENITLHTLDNGLRMVHVMRNSPVAWCGLAVNAGSRDEIDGHYGLAHFVEHTIFKGTKRRSSTRINNRIQLLSALIHQGRFFVLDECPALIDAIESAVYDPKKDEDERLDDGSTNIDSLDALEYSLEKYTKKLLRI